MLKHKQDLAAGSYESWFKKDVAELDFSKPADVVYNTIRAANPAPGAWATINGVKLDIYDAAKTAGTGKAGSILSISDQGVTIAAGQGSVLAKRVRAPGGQKIAAAEYAASAGLKVGDIFDQPAPKPAA
jgi:methionyl-tRNA formyltransferase